MRWFDRCVLAMALTAVAVGGVADSARSGAAPPEASGARRITEFSLSDVGGAKHTAAEWRANKAVVLFFIGTECPVSNGYAPAMQQIAAKYASRGVACFGIHADPSVTPDQATAHAKDYGLAFPILLDPEQSVARMARASVTPEAVVALADGKVLYRGRIDDRYALDGKRRDEATTRDLVDALEAVLAGQAPAVSETKAFGCPLPKPKRPSR
jgi:peroxiredoxin